MKIVFFDTETTGLLKSDASEVDEQPYVIEFYGIAYDEAFNKLCEFETFISAPIPLSKEITKITGISENDLAEAPSFISIFPRLCGLFLGSDTMVGHNLSFDTNMLGNELIRIDCLTKFPWPMNHVCTIEKSMSILGHRLSLSKLYALSTDGLAFDAHRARSDVEAMVVCYKWLQTKNLL